MKKTLKEEWEARPEGKFNFAREYQFPKDEDEYTADIQFYDDVLRDLPLAYRNLDVRLIEIEQDGEVTTFAVQADFTLG